MVDPVQEMLPWYGSVSTQTAATANAYRCVRFAAQTTITNLTQLAVNVTTGGGAGALCGFALYPDGTPGGDSGSVLISGNGKDCSAAGLLTTTASAFTLTKGNIYRLCFCSTATTTAYLALDPNTAGVYNQLQNAFTVSAGTGSSCLAGVTGSTSGSLSADTTHRMPVAVVAQ